MHKWLKPDPFSSSSLDQGTRLQMRPSLLTFIDMFLLANSTICYSDCWNCPRAEELTLWPLSCGISRVVCHNWSGKRLHVNNFVYIVQQSCHHCNLVPEPLPFVFAFTLMLHQFINRLQHTGHVCLQLTSQYVCS